MARENEDHLADPRTLTDLIVRMREHEPHFLSAMLRSGADDDNIRSSGWLKRIFGGEGTGSARAVLGGIAAAAAKRSLAGQAAA